jgi:hypothetical protein
MWGEQVIRAFARNRHGVVSRGNLFALGVTAQEIRTRQSTGRLDELHPGVYYLDCTPLTWRTRLLSAVTAAGSHAAASHRSAGVLWGLDGVFGRMIELTVPFSKEPDPEGTLVHRTRRPVPRTEIDSVPVATVERTILDLAGILPQPVLEKAVTSAIRNGHTKLELVDQTIARYGGRGVTGTRKLRRVLTIVEGDESGSPSEVDVAGLIRDAPIPAPVQQLRIPIADIPDAYPDFGWPDRMKIVEVDGFGSHSTPEQMSRDRQRQNALMSLGWDIRRFSAQDVRRDPHKVIAEIIDFVNS